MVAVEALFQALCDASALNPDSDMEEEAGAQLFFDEAEVLAGLPDDQRAALLAAQAEGAMALDEVDEVSVSGCCHMPCDQPVHLSRTVMGGGFTLLT